MTKFTNGAIDLTMLALATAMVFPAVMPAGARADSVVIEEKTVVEPTTVIERQVFVDPLAATTRSAYEKRFADMQEQIAMGRARGWLTGEQAAALTSWRNDCLKELSIFQSAGGGIVPQAYVDRLERHANSLAFMINKQIGAGSRLPPQ